MFYRGKEAARYTVEKKKVHLMVLLSNGTDANRYYESVTVTLDDIELGEVVSEYKINIATPVKSMDGRLLEVTIPADQVLTGTQEWSDLYYMINSSYD